MSMVLSPKSTTRPPSREGLTCASGSTFGLKQLKHIKMDLIGNLQGLGFLSGLRLFQDRLETGESSRRERGSGRNDDLQFSFVFGDQLVETLNDTLRLSHPSVLRQESEEVFCDFRDRLLLGTFSPCIESGETGGAILGGEGGIRDKTVEFGGGLDGAGKRVQLGFDLGQCRGGLCKGCREDSLRIFGGNSRGSATTEVVCQ